MREIPLKTWPNAAPDNQPVTSVALLRAVIRVGGPRGMSTDDVLTAMEIDGEVANAEGAATLRLEEGQWGWLVARLNDFRWVGAAPEIGAFIRDVRGAVTAAMNRPESV